MRTLESQDLADLILCQSLRMAVGSPRLLRHACLAPLNKSLPPFVAGLGTDPILGTQSPKVVRAHRPHHKLGSLIHRSYHFPRHRRAYRPANASLSVTDVWNHPRYPCSEPAPAELRSGKTALQIRLAGRQTLRPGRSRSPFQTRPPANAAKASSELSPSSAEVVDALDAMKRPLTTGDYGKFRSVMPGITPFYAFSRHFCAFAKKPCGWVAYAEQRRGGNFPVVSRYFRLGIARLCGFLRIFAYICVYLRIFAYICAYLRIRNLIFIYEG